MESKTEVKTDAPTIAESAKTAEELRLLMQRIIDNPESMQDIDEDDIIALRDRINPIGTFIPATKSCAVMSLVNMKEEYTRKLMMTAMIAFVYRRLEEYEPDFVTNMEESYAARVNAIVADSTPGANDMQTRRDALRDECTKRSKTYRDAHRDTIRAFLNSIFQFNPDKHVRKATADNTQTDAITVISSTAAAPTEGPISDAIIEASNVLRAEVDRYTEPAATDPEHLHTIICEDAEIIYRNARACEASSSQVYGLITKQMATTTDPADLGHLEDTRQLITKYRARFTAAADTIGPYAAARTALESANALAIIPPADVFHHFGRYYDSHYEILRILTDALYNTNSDIENIAIYYDSFDEEAKAREFMRIHEAEFRAEPFIIENGGVTLLGPFRENRARVDFYTRNTEVLRLMMEQVTRDQQLGKDLTKKRVINAKRRNVREAGPDDAAGLERYLGARQIISQFGKKPELSRDDRNHLAAAEQTRAEYETPDGTLAVRVLRPELDENGVPVDLQQSFFYTDAANAQGSKK